MSWLRSVRPRLVVLVILWGLPVLLYGAIGLMALYETGWFTFIAWTLPLMWLLAWLVGLWWRTPHTQNFRGPPLRAPDFWTDQDTAAIEVVESFRSHIEDVDRVSVADPYRYVRDAGALAERLAQHYTAGARATQLQHILHSLTVVDVLSVIHLAAEDLELWVLENVPGSRLATFGHLEKLPGLVRAVDVGQTLIFLATTLTNPSRLLTYPLWRKSGRITVELQNEVVRAFYQHYLKQVGFYLIEMYSGRLKGGSAQYRQRFGHLSQALHTAKGRRQAVDEVQDADVAIAVMGQVKAGKSSLINALVGERVAHTSLLPETRSVQRYEYSIPQSSHRLSLLDTPGYSEGDMDRRQKQEIQTAWASADIVLLVMAANSSDRDSDVQQVRRLLAHYAQQRHLKPPPIIAVLTHVDLLRPIHHWAPPHDWRAPASDKEQSMAAAVEYLGELFGDAVVDYACVNTDPELASATQVADELIPLLIKHLDDAHGSAVLKAFYQQLSEQRFARMSQQLTGLLQTLGRSLLAR